MQSRVAGSGCREASLTMAHAGPGSDFASSIAMEPKDAWSYVGQVGGRFGVANERTLRMRPSAKAFRPFGSPPPPGLRRGRHSPHQRLFRPFAHSPRRRFAVS
jgi:hypothetical protein